MSTRRRKRENMKRTHSSTNRQVEIRQIILEHIPKDAEITKVEFEGPALAIYTMKPEIRITHNRVITDMVGIIKK